MPKSNSLSFELALLSRMPAEYQASVLREIGLSEEALMTAIEKHPWPDLAYMMRRLEAYSSLFGLEYPNFQKRRVIPVGSSNLVDHYFLPILWPHLYWVASCDSEGICQESGFQNQTEMQCEPFDPTTVRIGLWTLTALKPLACSSKLFDGWDEEQVFRFEFESSQFDGVFVFGLLTTWSRVR